MKTYWRWLTEENLEAEQVTYNELLGFMKWCSQQRTSQRTIQSYIGNDHICTNILSGEEKTNKNPATDITVKGVKTKNTLSHLRTSRTACTLQQLSGQLISTQEEIKSDIGHARLSGLKNTRAWQTGSQ